MQQLYFRIEVLLCFVQCTIQFKVAFNVLHLQIIMSVELQNMTTFCSGLKAFTYYNQFYWYIFWLSFHFSRRQNRKSRCSVFLCSETKQKRLLLRLMICKNFFFGCTVHTCFFFPQSWPCMNFFLRLGGCRIFFPNLPNNSPQPVHASSRQLV